MKISCVLGSPRPRGNSATLASTFCAAAADSGAIVELFPLNKLRFRGCQGCEACKTRTDRCVLDDELTPVLESVRQAEVVLLASPVYYGDVTSQLKAFIDRTYSFVVPDYRTNPLRHRFAATKELVFILTQANPDERVHADIFGRYGVFFSVLGFDRRHVIRACGVNEVGEVATCRDRLRQAEALAREVCGSVLARSDEGGLPSPVPSHGDPRYPNDIQGKVRS